MLFGLLFVAAFTVAQFVIPNLETELRPKKEQYLQSTGPINLEQRKYGAFESNPFSDKAQFVQSTEGINACQKWETPGHAMESRVFSDALYGYPSIETMPEYLPLEYQSPLAVRHFVGEISPFWRTGRLNMLGTPGSSMAEGTFQGKHLGQHHFKSAVPEMYPKTTFENLIQARGPVRVAKDVKLRTGSIDALTSKNIEGLVQSGDAVEALYSLNKNAAE